MKWVPAFLSLLVCNESSGARGKQQPSWSMLRTKWAEDPKMGFFRQPREEKEAGNANYRKFSSHGDTVKFAGNRYVSDDFDIVLIFDANGYIAGIQSIVPKNLAEENDSAFSGNPMYNLDVIEGQEVYLATAYFVDPAIIGKGRTREEFERQGTGYELLLQNGPTPGKQNIMAAPLFAKDTSGTMWHRQECFLTMGYHYFFYGGHVPFVDQTCDSIFPVQLLYGYQEEVPLVGFAWQHLAPLRGDGWEVPNGLAYKAISDPPQCLVAMADDSKVGVMHVFFSDPEGTCQQQQQQQQHHGNGSPASAAAGPLSLTSALLAALSFLLL